MPKLDNVVAGYLKLRDAKKTITDRHKEELAPINAKMKTIEAWLLRDMQDRGALNTKTPFGTVYLSTSTTPKVVDRDEFLAFVRAHELWSMLTSHVSKDAVEEYLESTGDVPPGVEITRDTNARIRK